MRRTRLVAAAAALVLAAVPALPARAAPPPGLELVPWTIDSSNQAAWWSPFDTYVGAQQYAYFGLDEPGPTEGTHRVAVARRDGSGSWTRLPVLDRPGGTQVVFADDNGHRQPSVARDGSGRLHVFAGMHNEPWHYFRSPTPGAPPVDRSGELPLEGDGVTYPLLTTAANGDLWLAARVGPRTGSVTRQGRLYHWTDATGRWTPVGAFAVTPDRSVDPDDLVVDANGDVQLVFEWGHAGSSPYRHQLSYLRYRPATGAWYDSRGARTTVPVSLGTADVIQPLVPGEGYDDTGAAVQSAKLALDGVSPRVAFRYRPRGDAPFELELATPGPAGWTREVVAAAPTAAAVDVTVDPAAGVRVYYVRPSGADRAFVATRSTGAGWRSRSIAPGTAIDRLAVERNGTGRDIGYLVDTADRRLYHARL